MTTVHPKALIFDFEGTLVDFQWRLAEAEAEGSAALANLGMLREGSRGSYADLMNIALRYQENFGRSEGVTALSAIYDRFDADALTRWQVRDGVLETLKEIKNRGFWTGLVSNVGTDSLSKALERLGLNSFLDVSISRNEARWLKPHPAGIQTRFAGVCVARPRKSGMWGIAWMISGRPGMPGSRWPSSRGDKTGCPKSGKPDRIG